MEHERFILTLLQLPKVGRKSAWKIVKSQQDIARSVNELFDVVSATPGAPKVSYPEVERAWEDAEATLTDAKKKNIDVLAATRPDFPAWLKEIPDPPIILFIKGNRECISTPMGVAVIGTREPTDYGRKVAHRFGQRGAEAGYVVISGLAAGCDSEAHAGCLDAGGKTVAVLAHGLDRIYPKSSEALAHEIIEKNGCWISEYAPGVRAQRSHFVERDRLQSGLASGVIVVETDVDGGTMHTVRFAEDQGRPLAALSHPPDLIAFDKTRGNLMLIQAKRAKPLKEADDFKDFVSAVREAATRWIFMIDNMDVATKASEPPSEPKP
ncbi:MAG: DNA-processing protein DprA [Planctomycetes bacterium]|nr:DNA-processing protein DprA [Planctomycetota bacterium]